jgi:hypothetical protein
MTDRNGALALIQSEANSACCNWHMGNDVIVAVARVGYSLCPDRLVPAPIVPKMRSAIRTMSRSLPLFLTRRKPTTCW